jgi:hypothetical protein
MKKGKWLLCLLMTVWFMQPAESQVLRKIKEKAESAVNKAIDKKVDEKVGTGTQPDGPGGPGGKGKGGNTTGGGLVTTPPDVNASLTDAEAAFKKYQYGEARFSVQQAMLGVEMMIGKEILKGLPEKVDVLVKDSLSDKVASTSWGWVGLTIERDYLEGGRENTKDNRKELDFMLANNAAWMTAINMYLSGAYAQQSTGEQQNWKQTRLKGYKAVIEYEQSSGYKITVPIGQASLMILQGRNFATEQDFMKACETFDLDKIKAQIGEK